MKKLMILAAAFAAILPVSCNKEMTTPEVNAPEVTGVKVIMRTNIEDTPLTRLTLNDNVFSWDEGDEVKLRWASTYSDETLTAEFNEEDNSIVFEGVFVNEIPMYDETKVQNLYAHYAKNSTYNSETNIAFSKEVSSTQTGRLEDIDENAIYAAMIRRNNIDVEFDAESKPVSLEFNASMSPYFSLLKINVPESLALTTITLSAESDLVGKLCVVTSKINDSAHNNIFGSGTAQLVNMPSDGRSQSITVTREGNIISGDVYFVITPDEYDSTVGAYGNSAKSLKFTFATADEQYEFEAKLANKIQMGELKDLGTVPSTIATPYVDAGSIMLTNNTDFTLSISNANSDCTYYYEIGTSAADCKTPTVDSNILDLENGFKPSMAETSNSYFIKVLAHYTGSENYRDVILRASMKHWVFNEKSPVAEAYNDAVNSLSTVGSYVVTTDGLIVYRRADATLSYASSSGSIEYNNCIVPFISVERESNVYLYMRTSNVYNNAKQKAINLFYTNNMFSTISRVNTFNTDYTTYTLIYRPDDAVAQHVSVVWNLGAVNPEYKFAFAPDSKTTVYAHGILEVL